MVEAVHEKRALAERIIVIDPEDVDCAPALNMFDMTPARRERYSRAINEQIGPSVIETFNYVFGVAAELTSRQRRRVEQQRWTLFMNGGPARCRVRLLVMRCCESHYRDCVR